MNQTATSPARRIVALGAPLLVLACAYACLRITDLELWQHRPLGLVDSIGLLPVRLFLLGLAALGLLACFALHVVVSRRPLWWRRLVAMAICGAGTVLALEVAFSFVARSHNVGYTLASGVWNDRYWGPLNSLGYRDREHERVPGKRLVFALGDSFTAGGGLADRRQRFGDLLESKHPELHVLNLGRNGADSDDEYRNLLAHPLQPDVVVLQYYPNDIEGPAAREGHRMPPFTPYEDIPSVKARGIVRGSYLANYLYWQFPHADSHAYVDFLRRMLADRDVVARHVRELERFCDWSRDHNVPLVVVLFPVLTDLDDSRGLIAPVKQLFERRGVPVIDVADLVGDLEPAARIANSHDAHASALVHSRVADALFRVLGSH